MEYMKCMSVRNLGADGDGSQCFEGTAPPLSLSLMGGGRWQQAVCHTILNSAILALRKLIENTDGDANKPFRVRVEATSRGFYLWRTPLELAVERDRPDTCEMVTFLLEKGAQITVPTMQIALMVIDRNLDGLASCDSLAREPSPLFNILSQAGAQWGEAVKDNPQAERYFNRIQAHYRKLEDDVDRRLTALLGDDQKGPRKSMMQSFRG